jgi:hypothetical protein
MTNETSSKAKWMKYNLATSRMEGETKKWDDDWGVCWIRQDGRGSVDLKLGEETLKIGLFRQDRAPDKKGTLFNLGNSSEQDGEKTWERFGTLFLRDDKSGGALFLEMNG